MIGGNDMEIGFIKLTAVATVVVTVDELNVSQISVKTQK